jgi:hypothetical protein
MQEHTGVSRRDCGTRFVTNLSVRSVELTEDFGECGMVPPASLRRGGS